MAWLAQFKIGRPNAEALFEINPSALDWTSRKLVDEERHIDGSLCAVTTSRDRPQLKIAGNYITPTFLNQLRALMMVDDTMLCFESVSGTGLQVFESWTERVVPTSLTTLVIPDNSWLRGAALRVAAGGASPMTVVGVWSAPGVAGGRLGSGTTYTVSSYTDATRTILLTAPLPNLNAVFVTYRCPVLAVHAKLVPGHTEGGQVDVWRYDLDLEGA